MLNGGGPWACYSRATTPCTAKPCAGPGESPAHPRACQGCHRLAPLHPTPGRAEGCRPLCPGPAVGKAGCGGDSPGSVARHLATGAYAGCPRHPLPHPTWPTSQRAEGVAPFPLFRLPCPRGGTWRGWQTRLTPCRAESCTASLPPCQVATAPESGPGTLIPGAASPRRAVAPRWQTRFA
jgi:hypothetical protein